VSGFARAVFRFVRYPIGLRLRGLSLLAFKDLQQVHSCRPPHLLQPLHRHDGSKGLTLAFDDKLLVAECNSIQDIAESLANFQGRNFLYHSNKYDSCYSYILQARVADEGFIGIETAAFSSKLLEGKGAHVN
jgi:hypothetical protein